MLDQHPSYWSPWADESRVGRGNVLSGHDQCLVLEYPKWWFCQKMMKVLHRLAVMCSSNGGGANFTNKNVEASTLVTWRGVPVFPRSCGGHPGLEADSFRGRSEECKDARRQHSPPPAHRRGACVHRPINAVRSVVFYRSLVFRRWVIVLSGASDRAAALEPSVFSAQICAQNQGYRKARRKPTLASLA